MLFCMEDLQNTVQWSNRRDKETKRQRTTEQQLKKILVFKSEWIRQVYPHVSRIQAFYSSHNLQFVVFVKAVLWNRKILRQKNMTDIKEHFSSKEPFFVSVRVFKWDIFRCPLGPVILIPVIYRKCGQNLLFMTFLIRITIHHKGQQSLALVVKGALNALKWFGADCGTVALEVRIPKASCHDSLLVKGWRISSNPFKSVMRKCP